MVSETMKHEYLTGVGPNTEVRYTYRDASNWKAHARPVFAGRLTPAEVDAILAALDQGEFFIAEQVGLDALQGELGGRNDDDHCWHELDDLTATDRLPNAEFDIHELSRRFEAARWDETASLYGARP